MKRDANDVAAEEGSEALKNQTESLAAAAIENTWFGGVDLRGCTAEAAADDPEILNPVHCIATGFDGFDRLTGGLVLGEVTNLNAPMGMGKTVMVLNLLIRIVLDGTWACLFSLEMRHAEIWKVIYSMMSGIPRDHIRHRTLSTQEELKLSQTISELKTLPLLVVDKFKFSKNSGQAPTMENVEGAIKDALRKYNAKVFAIDYLGKIGPFVEEDSIRIPKLTYWVTDLAQRLNVHILFLSQSNKASFKPDSKGRRAFKLENVSGRLELSADCDNVIGLVRPDWNSPENGEVDPAPMQLVVSKCRYGRTGVVNLLFHKNLGLILEDTNAPSERQACEKQRAPIDVKGEFLAALTQHVQSMESVVLTMSRKTGHAEKSVKRELMMFLESQGARELESRDGLVDRDGFQIERRGNSFQFRRKDPA